MSLNSRKIWVPMPESDTYKRTVKRDDLVGKFGESTVLRAELATVMNLFILTGMITASEFTDAIIAQCERVEERRRADANLDADRG